MCWSNLATLLSPPPAKQSLLRSHQFPALQICNAQSLLKAAAAAAASSSSSSSSSPTQAIVLTTGGAATKVSSGGGGGGGGGRAGASRIVIPKVNIKVDSNGEKGKKSIFFLL